MLNNVALLMAEMDASEDGMLAALAEEIETIELLECEIEVLERK